MGEAAAVAVEVVGKWTGELCPLSTTCRGIFRNTDRKDKQERAIVLVMFRQGFSFLRLRWRKLSPRITRCGHGGQTIKGRAGEQSLAKISPHSSKRGWR